MEKEVVFNDLPVEGTGIGEGEGGEKEVKEAKEGEVSEDQEAGPSATASPQPNVVKTIKKIEYELLCTQHNPVRPSIHPLPPSSTNLPHP